MCMRYTGILIFENSFVAEIFNSGRSLYTYHISGGRRLVLDILCQAFGKLSYPRTVFPRLEQLPTSNTGPSEETLQRLNVTNSLSY